MVTMPRYAHIRSSPKRYSRNSIETSLKKVSDDIMYVVLNIHVYQEERLFIDFFYISLWS